MTRLMKIALVLLAYVLSITLLAGCTTATTPTGSSSSTTPAPTTETTTDGTTQGTTVPTTTPTTAVPFHINVIPEQLKGFAIAGQHCVFLVSLADEGQNSQAAVEISAKAVNAAVTIKNKAIKAGQVAGVDVMPASSSIGKSVEVTFTGRRGAMTDQVSRSFEVIEGTDDRQEYANELQARFVAWLAKVHPELGITGKTKWTGTMVSPQWLVVSHYLFFSEEWEMHIEWHIMIAPDDWARIDLRRRFKELKPSAAFEISSREAMHDPIAIAIPDTVWR